MATTSDAMAVKSLNTEPGRRRFVFKNFTERINDIDIDVFRSLHPVKAEPSQGQTFFLDCLVECRELNTAEDFISFYEEMLPLVQTLPQIIIKKESILDKLLDRMQMRGRLSLEPILWLIAALSRDLLEEFVLFLPKITNSIVSLLESGADREPEIIEQIFTSWSYILMYLQKYLTRDVIRFLNDTVKLRYYSKDYIQEFMAEAVSFLLRNAPLQQLIKGIKKVIHEVSKKPSTVRKSGVSALLCYTMRGTGSRFHSSAKEVLLLLLDSSIICIGDRVMEGSRSRERRDLSGIKGNHHRYGSTVVSSEPRRNNDSTSGKHQMRRVSEMQKQEVSEMQKQEEPVPTVLEVLVTAFQRLCEEMESSELCLMWDCLYSEIVQSESNADLLYLDRLLSLLLSTLQNGYVSKISDFEQILKLVKMLVRRFIYPEVDKGSQFPEEVDKSAQSEVVDKILQLIIRVIDGVSNDVSVLASAYPHWAVVFKLRNTSLLTFMKDILQKEPSVFQVSGSDIICALNELVETWEEDVIHMLLIICEKHVQETIFSSGVLSKNLTNILRHIHKATNLEDLSSIKFSEDRFARLWGIIRCYPYLADDGADANLLMGLVNNLELLINNHEFPVPAGQSLIATALTSYYKAFSRTNIGLEESVVGTFLNFAKKYKSSAQILSSVADTLDCIYGSVIEEGAGCRSYHPELVASKLVEALDVFAGNLCNPNKVVRCSTLRILSHYESLDDGCWSEVQLDEKRTKTDIPDAHRIDNRDFNVVRIFLLIEATPPSVASSRKIILLISKIQMLLSAARMSTHYIPVVLSGTIGIFHNSFSSIWDPALECLAILVEKHSRTLWEKYAQYLNHSLSTCILGHDQSASDNSVLSDGEMNLASGKKKNLASGKKKNLASKKKKEKKNLAPDLVARFRSHLSPQSDSTPPMTVLTYLIRALQKVPSVSESHSVDIVPLFFKFLGYNADNLVSVESYDFQICKGKEWKGVLKEWLNLFRLMRNIKSCYQGQFLKEVLLFRLIDDNDAELQMKALDCLLNWKDDYLRPYDQHLKNLINAKTLREELTTWGLSPESGYINVEHRSYLVPVVIRLLVPKVRKLRSLSSRKQTSVIHRKAILGFLGQLDAHELPLFFVLLLKPLQTMSQEIDLKMTCLWVPPSEVDSSSILNDFTAINIKTLSWKKLYGFLHVVEDVMSVFDAVRISPFLDLLMGGVVRILESCMLTIKTNKSSTTSNDEHVGETDILVLGGNAVKQTKELRSLCLKVISFALTKYEDHDFGGEFWDLFFTSVKPLISSFRQEGASSERPSSLFSCFLGMSTNHRIVPLLMREDNLIPDIFSMLTVVTASDAIVSSVFKFIENLLNLAEQSANDTSIRSILRPHIDILVSSIHFLFTQNNPSKRRMMRHPGIRELGVFRLLSNYITESSAAQKFVDFLLPILVKKPQNSDLCMETLHIMRHLVILIHCGSNKKIINSLSQLLTYSDLEIRPSICDVIDALAQSDVSLVDVAKLIRELNPIPTMDMGDFDYETKFAAYDKVNIDLFFAVQEEHAILILSHAIWDLSSDEKTLRESAYRLFLCFIEFCGRVLDGRVTQNHWSHSRASVQHVINNFILRHMGNAMNKEGPVQKMWIEILKEMVMKLPSLTCLESYRVLCSEDPEQDFFNNILHVQKHMRAKALTRFKNKISSEKFSEVILNKVLVPLFFNMLFSVQDGKGEHVRNSCLEALASVSGCLKWEPYYALLLRCFREMELKPDKQKILLRLICSILDHFHFSETFPHETNESGIDTLDSDTNMLHSSSPSTICASSEEIYCRPTCLQKNLLPKIQKMLTSNSDGVNVNVSLVALKLLKLRPEDIMDSQLPSIVHRISNFLKNRQESVRDEARSALAACLKELGLEFLQFIVKVLKSTLKRGFELHVLGYTLNFMLSKFLLYPINGKVDYCLEDLLSVVRNDILGDVAEEKEVDKLASKMKETRKQKSFETLKLIAQSITFKTHAFKLLSIVTFNLKKYPTPKLKRKLEGMLKEITSGIQCNPSVNHTELFVFVYGLIKDGITDELCEKTVLLRKEEQVTGEGINKETDRLIDVDPRYSHLITCFALDLLQSYMKNLKLNKKDEEMLSLLDPFVSLLGDCLISKYENIVSAALRCLTPLVRLPLPSLESEADKIKNSLLFIAQSSTSSSCLMESCIGLLTGLLRGTRVTLSTDQLHMLIQFSLFIDLEKNPSFVALSLLKAIVNRKLVVPEIYDLVNRVAEIMVMSQVEPVRKKCSQILLQFLLDYHLSKKRLQQHLDFLLAHLKEGYEYSTGKEAVLEMLHAIIMKFPVSILDEQSQTVFLNLVLRLANDPDNKVRSMIGAVIKLLIGRVSPHSLQAILDYSLSWYLSEKQQLWSAGAQVLGLLVEVMKTGFQKHISGNLLEKMRSILLSAMHVQLDSSDDASIPFWKEAYYTLIMLEKLLHQFSSLIFSHELKDIWEAICELMLHPHLWLRNISNRLLEICFTAVSVARRETNEVILQSFFLITPSRLFSVAASLCYQLKVPQIDDAAGNLITQNLLFSICGLHSSLTGNQSENPQKFWSSICPDEQKRFLKAFRLLDPRKGHILLASLTSNPGDAQNSEHYMVVSYLLKKLGKISLQMEPVQMKVVFNFFKLISPRLFDGCNTESSIIENDLQNYAYQILLPLYKVCEGYAGKIVSDDVKQLAQDVCDCVKNIIGYQNFVQIYNQIRKDLKGKRDKRKHGEMLSAVVDPMRNAKRKLRLAEKNRAYKKRKIMTMKVGKWRRR